MEEEVRYHKLRPAQAVARREACPVAWIPLGTIEFHGEHLPVGADGLQAEAVALRCARKGGGVVFPTLYYGESRVESLMDSNRKFGPVISEVMGLNFSNFDENKFPYGKREQVEFYTKLLIHILAEAETLGFKVGVLVAGHYPEIDWATAAATLFNKREYSRRHGLLAWAFIDYMLVREQYGKFDEHGGRWETSHLLAICPERVKLKNLPPDGEPMKGVYSDTPVHDANAKFGAETLDASAEAAARAVKDKLVNRGKYMGHGVSMRTE